MKTHLHCSNKKPSPTYISWCSMRMRCNNPNYHHYGRYGGAGVKICERWDKFESFLADMGERPSGKHSLDRYPNKAGDYEPDNCRWATAKQQNRNRKSTRPVRRSDGLTFPSIRDAAEATGANRVSIQRVCAGSQPSHQGWVWEYAS